MQIRKKHVDGKNSSLT